jgi:hypothetical protein
MKTTQTIGHYGTTTIKVVSYEGGREGLMLQSTPDTRMRVEYNWPSRGALRSWFEEAKVADLARFDLPSDLDEFVELFTVMRSWLDRTGRFTAGGE